MTPLTFRQIIYRLSIAGVILGILVNTYDIIFSSILEAFHILFEVIEVILDNVVEHLFDTGVHETQTIVFYVMMVGAVGMVYLLSHVLANLYRIFLDGCHTCVATYQNCKTSAHSYWHDMSLLHKITCIGGLTMVIIISMMLFGLM